MVSVTRNFEAGLFKRKVEVLALLAGLLFASNSTFAQGGASHFADSDSSGYESWRWITEHFGVDLFLTSEAYTLHFGRVGLFSLTGSGGLGVELRLRPVFMGCAFGASSNEIRPKPSGPFFYTLLYGGAIVRKCRIEIGETHGVYSEWGAPHNRDASYTTYFLGFSRRYG